MDMGKFIRKCVSDYLNNPIIIVPFVAMGLISTFVVVCMASVKYADTEFISFLVMSVMGAAQKSGVFSSDFSFGHIITSPLSAAGAFVSACSFIVAGALLHLALSFISSFFHASAIGLAQKIHAGRRLSLKNCLDTFWRGVGLFKFKVLLWLFTCIAAVLVLLPAAFLFGNVGIFLGIMCVTFFMLILQFVGFFGKQAVVLNRLGPWEAFVASYGIIRKNLENVLLLLGAYLFFFFSFRVLERIFVVFAGFFVDISIIPQFASVTNLILTLIILSPLFVLIKTSYFLKVQKPARGASH